MQSVLRIVDRVVVLTLYVGSAAVTALVTAMFIHSALRIPPDVLRRDAVIAAGLVGLGLLVAMAGAHENEN